MKTEKFQDSSNVLFTSDTHFYHKSMITLKRRPFSSIEEMNDVIVNNWNSVVDKDSVVFLLGDVSFGSPDDTRRIMERLNGQIRLIIGNHDQHKLLQVYKDRVTYSTDVMRVKFMDIGHEAFLSHYPHLTWNKSHYGAWHLHGHSHGSCVYPFEGGKLLDVGTDVHNFTPISVKQILEYMSTREIHSVDHHIRREH